MQILGDRHTDDLIDNLGVAVLKLGMVLLGFGFLEVTTVSGVLNAVVLVAIRRNKAWLPFPAVGLLDHSAGTLSPALSAQGHVLNTATSVL